MLSERERKTLTEIERGLCADYPDIEHCFVDAFDRPPRLWPYTAVTVIAIALLLAGIVLGTPSIFVVALLLGISSFGLRWLADRSHRRPSSAGDDSADGGPTSGI